MGRNGMDHISDITYILYNETGTGAAAFEINNQIIARLLTVHSKKRFTVTGARMSHRKWRETKEQLI